MMEPKPLDLYEFLVESELQHYYNSIKNELKISMVSHLKYASDEDLKQVGLSKPEIRRLRKFYEKFHPHGYLSKIKRLLQTPVVRKEDGSIINSAVSLESVKVEYSPSKIPNNKHIIPADSISVHKQLGTGEFGIVQQGVWTNGTERIQVAIKCLCRERMQSNPMEFLKEAAIMHSFEHENIVRLYGVVLDTDSLMLVTELAHLRSLLECLKDSGLRVSFLTLPTLCEFAQQICNGMMYLENKRLIHRDLAARNILVFSKNKVKISDFGLSRALGVGKDYYQTNFNVNLKLPIAWCAPECINFLRFTNSSDVWAYGVCLWEMFSYGFQPWAALTGHQILEAIDHPNYQRLEAPECCPKEYYTLMQRCWQHDPLLRPKFFDIYAMLPDMKPEQLKTIVGFSESKKDHLIYRQNEIISVLDKTTSSPYWKGVLNSGKTGIFNPANTVTYLGSLPSSTNRDSFCRTTLDRSSKRKLRPEMISKPQNDLKHTGHVGLDGAYFGDVAFLSNAQSYNHVPRQIVTPYKPSEDIEQTPLLLPATPTSPDSLQTASGYFPENSTTTTTTNYSFSNAAENNSTLRRAAASTDNVFDFSHQSAYPHSSNPFVTADGAFTNSANMDDDGYHKDQRNNKSIIWPDIDPAIASDPSHEYHEISDDEVAGDKVDMGPSLLDEMDFMFRSMGAGIEPEPKSPDFDNTNKKNEITELTSKMQRKIVAVAGSPGLSATLGPSKQSKKKSAGTVKPISVKDEKILNQAIDFANEISARSMTDLADTPSSSQSPKRKFSFRFPNLTHHSNNSAGGATSTTTDKDHHAQHHSMSANGGGGVNTGGTGSNQSNTSTLSYSIRRNFCEEIKNVPDLQNSITEESREAYNSLVEKPAEGLAFPAQTMGRFDYDKSKLEQFDECGSTTLPRQSFTDGRTSGGRQVAPFKKPIRKDLEFTVPSQHAPRPATLPHRSSMSKGPDVDSNPLRILRDKNYPIVRPRIKINTTHDQPIDGGAGTADACESPSYLTNPEYTFSERDVNIHHSGAAQKQHGTKEIENLNPIPLPPRDRTKIMLTNVKRHVRRHPLIIPGSASLQRTLNKVTTPVEERAPSEFPSPTRSSVDAFIREKQAANYNTNTTTSKKPFPEHSSKLKELEHSYVNQNVINSMDHQPKSSSDRYNSGRTYENINSICFEMQRDCTDSASLDFESILESDINKVGEMSSPEVTENGFNAFEMQKDFSEATANKSKESNVDIEKKKLEFSQKHPKYNQPKNELAQNSLFNKIKDTVESIDCVDHGKAESSEVVEPVATTTKLSGRELGLQSDEVRIMTKVLGAVASPDQFIVALDFIDWDVHKAIKLMMLQKTLNTLSLTLDDCVGALQQHDWDLQVTSLKLTGDHK